SKGSQASPHTPSVGWTTMPPWRSAAAASWMELGVMSLGIVLAASPETGSERRVVRLLHHALLARLEPGRSDQRLGGLEIGRERARRRLPGGLLRGRLLRRGLLCRRLLGGRLLRRGVLLCRGLLRGGLLRAEAAT